MDAFTELDTDDVDDAIAEDPPPRRHRVDAPGHRHVPPRKAVVEVGPSPWERPRENFTASMAERVPEMRATKEASYVKGTSREV